MDRALQALREDQSISEVTLKQLEEKETDIKRQLRAGNVKGALEVASPFLISPVLNKFVNGAYDGAYQTLKRGGVLRKCPWWVRGAARRYQS